MSEHDAVPRTAVNPASTAEATTTTGESMEPNPADATSETGSDLSKVRDLILSAYADLVPELLKGSTVDELMASVEPARAAYQRIVESVKSSPGQSVSAVPAGGGAARQFVVNVEELSPSAKIAEGLRQRAKRKGD